MVNSHGGFVWYELMTNDMQSAKAFYTHVMGWGARDVSMPGLPYSLFTVEDAAVTGLMNLPEDARRAKAAPHWMGYVRVDDVDAAVHRTKQLGGEIRVPPITIPNISRFAVVADPQGATLAIVRGMQPNQMPSPEPSTLGRVGWHELFAADWNQAFTFYSALFGWKKKDTDVSPLGTYQQFATHGAPIGGMSTKPATLPLPFWLYYFNVGDVDAAAKRVEDGGGKILYGPTAVEGGACVVHCADPQGAIFGLLNRPVRKAIGYFVGAPVSFDAPERP